MKIITKSCLNELKPAIHSLNIILLMFILPHSWITVIVSFVYTSIMVYVYTFLKKEEIPVTAVIGIIVVLLLLTGYIEGI